MHDNQLLLSSLCCSSRIEPLEHRDIITPSWKSSSDKTETADATSAENTSDATFVRRHLPHELDERRKFMAFFSAGLRRRNNSNSSTSNVPKQASSPSALTLPAHSEISQGSDVPLIETALSTQSDGASADIQLLSPVLPSESSRNRPRIVLEESDIMVMYQKITSWLPNPTTVAPYPPRVFPLSTAAYAAMQREDEEAAAVLAAQREVLQRSSVDAEE